MMADCVHFERLYRIDPDPWRVASDWYERRKRNLLLASLPRERYRHGFEPGCGNGETTVGLLERCERLCAVDFSPTAVELCSRRAQAVGQGRLDVRALPLPSQWPDVPAKGFDLIVVSELAYYFDDPSLEHFISQCLSSLGTEGHLVMCHWRHDAGDRRQPTDELHRRLAQRTGLATLLSHAESDFRLDIWEKLPCGGKP
ncbi:MAG TPA: class I SAM-dependent methyltransferase [Burkholderiaceae bacterium]